MQIFLNELEK